MVVHYNSRVLLLFSSRTTVVENFRYNDIVSSFFGGIGIEKKVYN